MPAVTLKQSTTHRHQNCGVRQAWSSATFAVVISFVLARLGFVALGLPVVGGHPDDECAEEHEAEIDRAHRDEGRSDAGGSRRLEGIHEREAEIRADEGAAAKAHDGHARGHAGPVGEPFHEGGNGCDVTQAQAASPENAIAHVDEPELMPGDAERGDEKATAETARRGEHGFARAVLLDPASEDGGGDAEEGDGDAEDPGERGLGPIARGGLGDSEDLGERKLENAEGVNLADGKMDGERGGRHEPTVVARPGDGVLAIEEGHGIGKKRGLEGAADSSAPQFRAAPLRISSAAASESGEGATVMSTLLLVGVLLRLAVLLMGTSTLASGK